jgi:SSS family solute:Na+ symporter
VDVDFLGPVFGDIDPRKRLLRLRILSLVILSLSLILVLTGLDSTILQWSYLSMGLRGSAIFVGLCIAVFLPRWTGWPVWKPVLYLLPLIYIVLSLRLR